MNYLSVQKLIITAYRLMSFVMLTGILTVVISYLCLLIFYTTNSTWAAPAILSPAQERVLAFQPEVATLEETVKKQQADLTATVASKEAAELQLTELSTLLERVDATIEAESKQLDTASRSIGTLLDEKRADIAKATATLNQAKRLAAQINAELAAKLITSDQAAQRRLALQAATSSLVDSKGAALALELQLQQTRSGADTLSGSATSSTALGVIRQAVELKTMVAQLKIQVASNIDTIATLKSSIESSNRLLAVAKSSPYYRALRERMTVAFVPYDNLAHMHIGDPVYDCYLQVLLCRNVGTVVTLYDAEEKVKHPVFKTDLRGRLIELKFTDLDSSKSSVVFIGSKPLLL